MKSQLLQLTLLVTSMVSSVLSIDPEPKLIYSRKLTPQSLDHTERLLLNFTEVTVWNNDPFFEDLFPDSNCFLLRKTGNANASARVFSDMKFAFDLEQKQQPRPMFASTQTEVRFCLDEYVFLNRMKQFYLYLTTGGVLHNPNHLGNSDDPVEVALFRLQSAHKSIVQEPWNATLTGGWFLFSHQLSLGFEVPEVTNKMYSICDMVNNCNLMHHTGSDNGTTLYSVPDNVFEYLAESSPFVRFEGDYSKQLPVGYDSHFKLSYNHANKRTSERLQVFYPNATRHSETAFSVVRKVSRGSNTLQVRLPVFTFDPRVQQVLVSATILHGYNSSIRVTGWRHSPTGYAFTVPSGLNQDASQVNVSSEEFLTLDLDELQDQEFINQVLELSYVVSFDNAKLVYDAELEVRLQLQVQLLDAGLTHTNPKSYLSNLVDFPVENMFDPKQSVRVQGEENHARLLWTSWTYDRSDSAVKNATHGLYTTVELRFSLNQIGLELNRSLSKLTLERLILGSRGRHFARTPLRLHHLNQTHAMVKDPIAFDDLPQVERFFKLGYVINFNDKSEQLGLDFEGIDLSTSFRVDGHHFDHSENCKHVPTFAQFDCDQQLFECPVGFFHYDQKQGACKLHN